MKKRVLVIAALVSGALAVSGCTTNPYTGEREAGKSGIGAGIGSLGGRWRWRTLLLQERSRQRCADWRSGRRSPRAAAWVITWTCRKQNCVTK